MKRTTPEAEDRTIAKRQREAGELRRRGEPAKELANQLREFAAAFGQAETYAVVKSALGSRPRGKPRSHAIASRDALRLLVYHALVVGDPSQNPHSVARFLVSSALGDGQDPETIERALRGQLAEGH